MCFSAGASFAASGVTAVAGVAAFSVAKKPAFRLLAAIPIFFALHQLAEGVLWLTLGDDVDAAWQGPAMFTFLVVAKIVWPAWVPLAVRAVEEDAGRRKVLSVLVVLGVLESVLFVYALQAYEVSANIAGGHVQYHIETPLPLRWVVDPIYAVVTVIPPLVSSIRMMRYIGVVVLASLIVSKIFYFDYFASVWCFFAALISLLVVLVVRAHVKRGEAVRGEALEA